MSIKNSEVIMAKEIKVDRDYKNVLNYSEQQMLDLVKANRVNGASNFGFVGDGFTNTIRVPFSYAECIQSNYLAFQNKFFANKWFFAWIDNVAYINDNTCELTFTVDSWSTWFSYWTPEVTFVNREHTNDDTIGANTISENIAVDEVVCEQTTQDSALNQYLYIAIMSNYDPANKQDYNYITAYNGMVFGSPIFLFPYNLTEGSEASNAETMKRIVKFIGGCVLAKRTDAIQCIFALPSALIKARDLELINKDDYYYYKLQYNYKPAEINFNINKRTTFSDYTPKNNKCFVYPYNYLEVTNMNGETNIYKYENFYNEQATFLLNLALQIGCSGRLIPTNYKKKTLNNEESIALGKYPTFSWSGDAYVNWLTEQAVNNVISPIMSLGATALGAVVGGVPGAIAGYAGANWLLGSGGSVDSSATKEAQSTVNTAVAGTANVGMSIANTVLGTFGNFYAGSLISNIPTGTNTADVNFVSNQIGFKFNEMRAKTEYLKRIDEFFTMFGYKTNSLKMPNITGRKNWNYVEISSNSDIGFGTVPSIYMEEINNACRRGVTIWHNHATLGDYSQDNSIV